MRSISGNNTWNGPISLGSAARINSDAGTLAIGGGITGTNTTLTVGGAGNINITGAIGTGTGGLTKDGAGTLTVSGANTFTGATTINAGTLALGASNTLSASTAVTVASGATFNLNSNTQTVGSIAGAGSILIGTGQLLAGGDNSSTAFSGTLGGTGTFTKQGSGQLTFSGNIDAGNSFAGGTVALNAGSLLFSAANTGDSAVANNNFSLSINASANPTLYLSNANVYLKNLTMTGTGTITIDFGGAASTLSVLGTLNIGAGVQVTITNWQDAVDYWFAQNWTGAVFDTRGIAPMNQITFNPPTWTNNNTWWQSWDKQINPVPEPSAYGAALLAVLSGLGLWRNRRRHTGSAPATKAD
jgi:autotransporter-associated beta strand protein